MELDAQNASLESSYMEGSACWKPSERTLPRLAMRCVDAKVVATTTLLLCYALAYLIVEHSAGRGRHPKPESAIAKRGSA